MSAADVAFAVAEAGIAAVQAGIEAAKQGKDIDEALMAIVEHVQTQRAKEKFPNFQEG